MDIITMVLSILFVLTLLYSIMQTIICNDLIEQRDFYYDNMVKFGSRLEYLTKKRINVPQYEEYEE